MGTTDRLAFTTIDSGNDSMAELDQDLTFIYSRIDAVVGAISLTTAQRDALTLNYNGRLIYNTTVGETQFYENGVWLTFGTYDENMVYKGQHLVTSPGAVTTNLCDIFKTVDMVQGNTYMYTYQTNIDDTSGSGQLSFYKIYYKAGATAPATTDSALSLEWNAQYIPAGTTSATHLRTHILEWTAASGQYTFGIANSSATTATRPVYAFLAITDIGVRA